MGPDGVSHFHAMTGFGRRGFGTPTIVLHEPVDKEKEMAEGTFVEVTGEPTHILVSHLSRQAAPYHTALAYEESAYSLEEALAKAKAHLGMNYADPQQIVKVGTREVVLDRTALLQALRT